MTNIEVGKTYYFVGIFHTYTVKVIRKGRFFSLCKWSVNDIDYGRSYTVMGLKANWRLIK